MPLETMTPQRVRLRLVQREAGGGHRLLGGDQASWVKRPIRLASGLPM